MSTIKGTSSTSAGAAKPSGNAKTVQQQLDSLLAALAQRSIEATEVTSAISSATYTSKSQAKPIEKTSSTADAPTDLLLSQLCSLWLECNIQPKQSNQCMREPLAKKLEIQQAQFSSLENIVIDRSDTLTALKAR
jgi:hypothetical protein